MRKPTIAELEAILEEKDVKFEILPNGEVRVLAPHEDEDLAVRLKAIATELYHYAFGRDKTGERYPEWEESAMAFMALDRAVERLQQRKQCKIEQEAETHETASYPRWGTQ
jgi:hypothetical protein